MEEDIEMLDNEGEGLEQENGSNNVSTSRNANSPLRNAVTNIAGATLDSNKYKSMLNRKNPNDDNSASMAKKDFNKAIPEKRPSVVNNSKNILGNKALDTVSNLHPALKAINTANNIRNVISRRRPNNANGNGVSVTNSDDSSTNTKNNDVIPSSTVTNGEVDDSSTDTSSRGDILSSLNPLSGLSGLTGGISFGFSFLGRIPMPLKITILLSPLFIIFFVISLPSNVVGFFTGFWGTDVVLASDGSTSNAGTIDYGDYELSSDGDQILHESLSSFLESHGSSLTEFNGLISSNVQNSGYGTRAGVVAAAVTLIAELGNNYNVKIPYYWGGGHGRMIEGADGNWGSSSCHTYANGQSYNYCGLDCSGFVAWAIYNGGFNVAARSAGSFQNLPGAERVTLSSGSAVLQPGDLMESNSHVVLVVDVIDGGYVVAEAAGNSTGVKFSTKRFGANGYWGVNMDGFYEQQVRS